MSNTFQTSQLVAKMALPYFENKLTFLQTGNYEVSDEWNGNTAYQLGDTVNIRRQVRFRGGDGQTATAEDIIEETDAVTINHQYWEFISYSAKDLTLSMPKDRKRFFGRYIKPALDGIYARMQADIAQDAAWQLYQNAGTVGSPINSYSAQDVISQVLREKGVPDNELYLALSLADGGALRAAYTNNFNMVLNKGVNERARIARLGFFDIYEDQSIYTQLTGTRTTPAAISTTVTSGATSIVLKGLGAAATIKKGEKFSVAGRYSINNLTYRSTGRPIQFVVTADATASGAGVATVSVSPAVISDSTNPRQNVDSAITADDVVTFVGAASSSFKSNVAFHKNALSIACPLIEPLDTPYSATAKSDKGIPVSLRISRIGDITNSKNLLRVDVLAGWKWHGEYGGILVS